MRAIPGFDLGNSPREYTAETVEGKTVLLTTTNGTVALRDLSARVLSREGWSVRPDDLVFTGNGRQGIAAACFYTASYAAMNVGAFAVVTAVSGYHETLRTSDDYQGLAHDAAGKR